jgi:hypothetical protein
MTTCSITLGPGVNVIKSFGARAEQLLRTSFLMILMADRIWQKKPKMRVVCAKFKTRKFLAQLLMKFKLNPRKF